MEAEHYAALHRNDRDYWWFAVRYAVTRRLLTRDVPKARALRRDSLLVDVGCGTGGFLEDVIQSELLSKDQVLGIESKSETRSPGWPIGTSVAALAVKDS